MPPDGDAAELAALLDADDSAAPSLQGALLALALMQQLVPAPAPLRLVLLTHGALTAASAPARSQPTPSRRRVMLRRTAPPWA